MPRVTKDTKKEKTTEKKKTTKKVTKASSIAKKTSSTTKKKATSTTSSKKVTTKKIENNIVAEYYDLPYRYNETMVKILYQTPTILFVYWDISDTDRNQLIEQYGNDFFNTTYPVLRVNNITKNYSFEVPINDFANSWYIHVEDAGCDYKIDLFRKYIERQQEDIYVSSSNDIEFPNDHILLEQLPDNIYFRNVKTNEVSAKNIATLRFVGIQNIHSIHDFYKKLYGNEILEELDNKKFINPSSSSW